MTPDSRIMMRIWVTPGIMTVWRSDEDVGHRPVDKSIPLKVIAIPLFYTLPAILALGTSFSIHLLS
jgi:hypothetical protein